MPTEPVFVIATKHKQFADEKFPEGSVVIDPWRYIPDQKGVTVKRLGQNQPALISLLIPSRGRPESFLEMVLSAFKTAARPGRLEVICYLDEDDPRRKRYLKLKEVTYIVGERIVLSEMWNRCYEESKGEILMHCGDDIRFLTDGWDLFVRKEFDKSEDKVLFVHGDDLGPHGQTFGTHGFVHRKWVETLGYFVPPLFSSDWNDVWLNEVADDIGRRVLIPIVTEHLHYTFGKFERDQTHADREERGTRDNVVELYRKTKKDRKKDAAKLRAVMT